MDSWGSFFNSDLGKNLTNIGVTAISNSLKLTSNGKTSNAVVQPVTQVVQGGAVNDSNMMYWIAGGGAILILAVVLITRR